MIQEVFKTIRDIKPFFLLVIFLTLSMVIYIENGILLENPLNTRALLIPLLAMFAYALAWVWVFFIIRASVILPKEDLANLGYLIACSLMVLALLITFSYIGKHSESISFSILNKPGFTYTCTLYLMSLVAFDAAR